MCDKNSKSRIAAIRAMGRLLYCNPFKGAYDITN
jgi:hypothetical protein